MCGVRCAVCGAACGVRCVVCGVCVAVGGAWRVERGETAYGRRAQMGVCEDLVRRYAVTTLAPIPYYSISN